MQSNATANASMGLADQTLGAAGVTGTRVSTFGSSANLTTVMLATPTPPALLFVHADQLGSTRLLTDNAGGVRASFTYDPYGNVTASSGTSSTPFAFAGQYKDVETGFYYLHARYYDPTTAQFLTRDPALATTREPYAYVAGNPLNVTDASGRDAWANDPMTQSGFDPHDPNYCWKLQQLIRAQNNVVGQRWRDQYAHLDQLRSGDLALWQRYHGHEIQFLAQQTRLQLLIDEWNNGPCGNSPLPRGATDWASRSDPAIEAGDRSLANALNNPPPAQPPTSHQDSGLPGWLLPIAGVAIVGQAILAPETLPLDVLAA